MVIFHRFLYVYQRVVDRDSGSVDGKKFAAAKGGLKQLKPMKMEYPLVDIQKTF